MPGFDATLVLRKAGGQLTALQRVLGRFVSTDREAKAALARPAQDRSLEQWHRACHWLRGACATVGASALQAQAQALELKLHDEADAVALALQAQALNAALQQLVQQLGAPLTPPSRLQ